MVGALNALYVYTSFPFGGKDNAPATHCIVTRFTDKHDTDVDRAD